MAPEEGSKPTIGTEQTGMASEQWSLQEKLRNKEYRGKLLHSLWIAMALFALGATAAQGGPTFLDLQIITNTNVEKASTFFTSRSCGELTGSILSGLIGYKINRSLLILLSTISMGVTTIAIPYCSVYGLMIFIKYLGGLSEGLLNTTGNAEHMRIWGRDGRALTQFLHFCASLGCLLSPLITEPFVAERMDIKSLNSSSQNDSLHNTDMISTNTIMHSPQSYDFQNTTIALMSNETTSLVNKNVGRDTSVHYAFLIVGLIAFIVSMPFVYLFLQTRTKQEISQATQSQQDGYRKLPVGLHIFVVLCLCAFYISCRCIEDLFAGFLMTFVVREYPFVSKATGAYITAVYWGCYAAARFLMIFVSKVLNSVQLLFLCGSLMSISSVSFTVSAAYAAITPLTVFAGMAGLSMSAVFPAGMSWCESELVKVTPRVSSSIFVSAAIGAMLSPLLLAFLMEHLANMWFCYLLLIEFGMVSLVYVFLLLFNRFYVNKRYGPLLEPKENSDFLQTFIHKEKETVYRQP